MAMAFASPAHARGVTFQSHSVLDSRALRVARGLARTELLNPRRSGGVPPARAQRTAASKQEAVLPSLESASDGGKPVGAVTDGAKSQILTDLHQRREKRRQRFQKLQQREQALAAASGLEPSHTSSRGESLAPASASPTSISTDQVVASTALHGVQRPLARVNFTLRFQTNWGQRLCLTGSQEPLGDWDVTRALKMEWTSGDNWVAEVNLPTGTVYEYKFVVVDYTSGEPRMWQSGNNSVLALRATDRQVDVFDNWVGAPGAKLVADNSKPVTKEQRLLSWATELETAMLSQRQELRRARMELAAAQEEARTAREESKRMYARLAESEAARLDATTNLVAAESANKVLRAQLTEVNTSFKTALETASELLHRMGARALSKTADGAPGNNEVESPGVSSQSGAVTTAAKTTGEPTLQSDEEEEEEEDGDEGADSEGAETVEQTAPAAEAAPEDRTPSLAPEAL